jgi:hypothetical protein
MIQLPEHLQGAADLHVHSSPDIVPRRYDDIELAREAVRAGLSAVLIKSHQNSTVERAALVSEVVTGIHVFGGLVLNETVGGFNLAAVQLALAMGAKQIWMPTKSALNHRRYEGSGNTGLTVLDEAGELRPEVNLILSELVGHDCILGTGHLSPEEGTALIQRAHALGVRRILVTHPEWAATYYPEDLQKELACLGANFERCFVSTTHLCGFTPFSTIEKAIADVGVESTVLSTDLGQPDTPSPVEGLALYSEKLLAAGFSAADIRRMTVENPRQLIGLEPMDGA